jgi:adhesin HecA-like repeat protein
MNLTPDWQFVADTVMGGVSTGQARWDEVAGRRALHLTGDVSLDNNGGFVQVAGDLVASGTLLDASGWTGIAFDTYGNGEAYEVRLRTDALTRPWQSFRAEFIAPPDWTTHHIPFTAFTPHRTEAAFDPARLRRIGFLAIGREMTADLAITGLHLYR